MSSRKTFFCRNLKNGRMSFLGRCNVETVSCPGFYGLSCSKLEGFEVGVFQKLFNGYIFCFLGHLVGGYIFELFARETNLKKKRNVIQSESNILGSICNQFLKLFAASPAWRQNFDLPILI